MYINGSIPNKDSPNPCSPVKVSAKYHTKHAKYNRFIVWFHEMFLEILKKDSVPIDLIVSGERANKISHRWP